MIKGPSKKYKKKMAKKWGRAKNCYNVKIIGSGPITTAETMEAIKFIFGRM